jgi:hypothetical protein
MKKLITMAALFDNSSLPLYTAFNAHVIKGPDGAGQWFCNLPPSMRSRTACR